MCHISSIYCTISQETHKKVFPAVVLNYSLWRAQVNPTTFSLIYLFSDLYMLVCNRMSLLQATHTTKHQGSTKCKDTAVIFIHMNWIKSRKVYYEAIILQGEFSSFTFPLEISEMNMKIKTYYVKNYHSVMGVELNLIRFLLTYNAKACK